MRTAQELLDWSFPYHDIGSDGFKAELVWLAWLYDLHSHEAVQGLTFQSSEWEAFAAALNPAYQSDWDMLIPEQTAEHAADYDLMQLVAIKCLSDQLAMAIPIEGDLNERVHKVIWCSNFGQAQIQIPSAVPQFEEDLLLPLSNDDRAKVYLALVLLGQDPFSPVDILNQNLQPQTYHEILCTLAGNRLKELRA